MTINKTELLLSIHKYKSYLKNYPLKDSIPELFIGSNTSVYSLCFYIFNLNLVKEFTLINKFKNKWISILINELNIMNKDKNPDNFLNKENLQKFTFILSSLKILEYNAFNKIYYHNDYFVNLNIDDYFNKFGINQGSPQSGNYSMFLVIIFLFLQDSHKIDMSKKINKWITLSTKSMNKNFLWGTKLYLQFQNGYHQYEIFEYLNIRDKKYNFSNYLLNLSDNNHFAPYPYGGSCYDYDAIFLLTPNGNFNKNNLRLRKFLSNFVNNLLSEQNFDGGFCESRYLYRRKYIKFACNYFLFIFRSSSVSQVYEKFRNFISLSRTKNKTIITHWTKKNRDWDQSNLWDSWFRMQAIARIVTAFDLPEADFFNFINYPGIGYNLKKFK